MKNMKSNKSRVDELSRMDRDRETNRLGLDILFPHARTSSDTNAHVNGRNYIQVKPHIMIIAP